MLEQIDLSLKLSKEEFDRQILKISPRLIELQRRCKEAGIPIIVIFEGWDAAGKEEAINRLLRIIDPRGCRAYALDGLSSDGRPLMWPYIVRQPHRGFMTLFIGSWYGKVIHGKIDGSLSPDKVMETYEDITAHERRISDDGYCIIKFWFHISRKEQKKRFRKLEEDPLESWKVDAEKRRRARKYREYKAAIEEMLQKTSITASPWTIIEAEDRNFARLKTFEAIARAMESALARNERRRKSKRPASSPDRKQYRTEVAESEAFLKRYDLTRCISPAKYEKRLQEVQDAMRRAQSLMHIKGVPASVVFEGWDAAGKGGSIKRLLAPLEPSLFEVVTTARPTQEDLGHHYLWRFWKRVPRAGRLVIFDRSWYGRVLVERVERLCSMDEWQRAYQEINEFERMLVRSGTVLVKLWLHIDKDEQLRRFRDRVRNPAKRWKITEEDKRNRKRWEDYELAVSEMLLKTSTTYAPWSVIESNDKYYSRVRVIDTVVNALMAGLGETARHAGSKRGRDRTKP